MQNAHRLPDLLRTDAKTPGSLNAEETQALFSEISSIVEPVGGWPKRVFDFVSAAIGLMVISPLLLLVMLLVKCSDSGPTFFLQQRVGYRGRRFNCYKFRTMVADAEAQLQRLLEQSDLARAEWKATEKLRHDPRITRIGQILRLSSVDELPQLVNVLRGEMSLVGPRPILENEIPRYRERLYDYLRARPGLTGLWQVSGRNDVSYEMRTALDQRYVRTWSMFGDFAIILRTIAVVLSCKGCY
jgi:exopolysaccharide production protein ExoY